MTRLIAWNILAGGGRRIDAIAENIARWKADVVALSEFRATPPSMRLAETLADQGLSYQLTTADPRRAALNRLLVASRWPVSRLRLAATPEPSSNWLLVRLQAPEPFAVGALHIPMASFSGGAKYAFHDAVLRIVRRWRRGPALICGDTNSGRIGIDEESPVFNARTDGWMAAMACAGWHDAWRRLRGDERVYTWYSPNAGNGFRLDQAFVNRALLPRLLNAHYEWGVGGGTRRSSVSDHAALILDLGDSA